MKLKEGQLDNVFQCLINGLFDEKEEEYNRKNCAQLLGKLSMKWNEQQLNDAFNSLKFMLNEEKLSGKQFVNAFKYFISRFNCGEYIYNDKYANLLEEIAQRLDEKQMNIELNYFMDKLMTDMNIKIFVSSAFKYLK
ncbi:hypothetical protein RFI_38065 [Reticulomyxa filosa]|uniref:Uncharacterized protein n=1 Tax=Reticulomyxa filosa TaxID=46433 RepID=X6LE92_RETFI|nr:hypothetical protein RFI_38065 [Reticulomyxa filosa]|eukprot:ETN99416.1 hypothetical protein RFI_38065 [Reticulomyxa filosa]